MLVISRLDKNFIVARSNSPDEENAVKSGGVWEWSRSEKAFICPRPKIVDIVDRAQRDNLSAEYPEDLYRMEKMGRIAFEGTLSALRSQRQTGVRMEDIDYFRDHFKGQFLPYRHQLVTFQYIDLLEQCAIFNEMGTGKTASVIWDIDWRLIQKRIYSALIVAPNNILHNWKKEVSIHAPHLKVHILQGTRNERLDKLDDFAHIYVINYEGLAVLGDELKHKFQMVVLDEAHKIKDPGAKQTKVVLGLLSDVTFKVAMTGTPIGNNLIDLHQLMTWIDPFMFEPFYIFRAHLFYSAGFKWYPNRMNPSLGGISTERFMQDKVYTRAVRYRKDECLDLPPKTYITRSCVLDATQAIAYRQMLKVFMSEMEEGIITAKNVLSKMIKLSEITSGFIRDSEGRDHVFSKCAKLDLLGDILEEIGSEAKVVIWARYVSDIKRIGKMLGSKAVLLYGATSKGGKALEIVDKFQASDPRDLQYIVGNPAVGGLGLNMTAASYAIYYSNDYSWIKRSQSEDRIHRMGSEKHHQITIMDLVCELVPGVATIDMPVVKALTDKKELARVIIDVYKAGVTDAFGLMKEHREAEERLIGAAINLSKVESFIDFSRPEYSSSFELKEPECPSCSSKNVLPTTSGTMECKDCGEEWD